MTDAWDDGTEVTNPITSTKKWADEDTHNTKPKAASKTPEQLAREQKHAEELRIKQERSANDLKAALAPKGKRSLKSNLQTHAQQVENQNKERTRKKNLARWLECSEAQVDHLVKILPKADLMKRIADGKIRDNAQK